MNRYITNKNRKMLWGRSAGLCSMPECRTELTKLTSTPLESVNIGEEHHIFELHAAIKLKQDPNVINAYENLILICRNCHKKIHDNPSSYDEEKLEKIKKSHEEWVAKNVKSFNEENQKEDEYYAYVLDQWEKLIDIENWEEWTARALENRTPNVAIETIDAFEELNQFMIGRIWPGKYLRLEASFKNTHAILQDIIQFTGYMHADSKQRRLEVPIFYKLIGWNPDLYEKLVEKHRTYILTISNLVIEITRSANWVADEVRSSIISDYRLYEGLLLICDDGKIKSPQYFVNQKETLKPYRGYNHLVVNIRDRDDGYELNWTSDLDEIWR